jgi:hypothetical protein
MARVACVTQGNDECSGVIIAAHFGRSLDLQFDPQEQIPCALYFYNRKKAINA